MQNLWNNVQ